MTALETTFAGHLNEICISNTKGFTGHTLGAAIEDVVLVKALQQRKAPPIANLTKVPAHFQKLNFSGQENIDSEYGLHLSAGFGSHFAFMFVKRVQENQVEGNLAYHRWLRKVSGVQKPELKIIDNTLCVVAGDPEAPSALTDTSSQAPAVRPAATKEAPAKPVSPIQTVPAPATSVTSEVPVSGPDKGRTAEKSKR